MLVKLLRTPDERFTNLPDWPYEPRYVDVGGPRMHTVDVGAGDPILCLHGEPSWGFLYRKMIPTLNKHARVVVPDLIGFGRSDKPAEREDHSVEAHLQWLTRLIESLDLRRATLVCQDWGGLFGLCAVSRMPDRFARIVVMNTGLPTGDEKPSPAFLAWQDFARTVEDMPIGRIIQSASLSSLSDEILAGYEAPFPDRTYKAGAHQLPLLVPTSPDNVASETFRKARGVFKEWTKPALVLFSDSDPITAGGDRWFRKLIPSASEEPEMRIAGGGHFLQEDKGEEIAERIVEFIARRPV